MEGKEHNAKKSPLVGITKPSSETRAKMEAKNRAQKSLANAIKKGAADIEDLFGNPEIAARINSNLPVAKRVTLARMNTTLNKGTSDSLYNNHAETLPYKTTVSAAKKSDDGEAGNMFEEVRKAVNIAYQLLTDYLKGEELTPSNYEISHDRWKDFLNKLSAYKDSSGRTMHPSTSSGYIIEDITTHILTSWDENELGKGDYNFQDTAIMGGKSRPDITSTTDNDQRVLMDITSQASKGHILKKKGNWLKFPHVAELLYPAVNFSNPGAINIPLSDAERKDILKKAIKDQIAIESQRYADFINKRKLYYKGIQERVDNLLSGKYKPSKRKLKTFLGANPNIQITITDDKYVINVDSYTTYKGKFDFDPYEDMPKSPPQYSMDIDEEDDLIAESEKTKYLPVSDYKSLLKKKLNS